MRDAVLVCDAESWEEKKVKLMGFKSIRAPEKQNSTPWHDPCSVGEMGLAYDMDEVVERAVSCGVRATNSEEVTRHSPSEESDEVRRPSGIQPVLRPGGPPAARYLSQMSRGAELSSEMFQMLALELYQLRAPRSFVRNAAALTRSERKVAKHLESLSVRFGSPRYSHLPTRRVLRDLYGVALEQAGEGSVRGAFRAAQLAHMTSTALDSATRTELLPLIEPTSAAVQLSLEVLDWATSQLSPRRCRHVKAARVRALGSLRQELTEELEEVERMLLGAPSARASEAMLDALETDLFAEN